MDNLKYSNYLICLSSLHWLWDCESVNNSSQVQLGRSPLLRERERERERETVTVSDHNFLFDSLVWSSLVRLMKPPCGPAGSLINVVMSARPGYLICFDTTMCKNVPSRLIRKYLGIIVQPSVPTLIRSQVFHSAAGQAHISLHYRPDQSITSLCFYLPYLGWARSSCSNRNV